jgi:hypothetical protein
LGVVPLRPSREWLLPGAFWFPSSSKECLFKGILMHYHAAATDDELVSEVRSHYFTTINQDKKGGSNELE